jgi:acyl carrier protein
MDVERELRAVLDRRLKDAPPLDSNSRLADLNLDSLDFVEMLFEIEDKYDVHIVQSNEQAANATFGQLCEWVASAIAAKAATHTDAQPTGGGSGPAPSTARR